MSDGFIRRHARLRGCARIQAVLAGEVQLELKRCTITHTAQRATTTHTVMGTVMDWADIRMYRCLRRE
jgi:hypothetical protein